MKKLDNKAIKCRFLAHEGKLIFRVWDIKGERVFRSAHVVFDEKASIALNEDAFMSFEDANPDEHCL